MSILDADLDYNGTDVVDTEGTDTRDFDSWMREMLDGEDTGAAQYDAEDADWNENYFEGEDDADEEFDAQTEATYQAVFGTVAQAEVAPAPSIEVYQSVEAPAKERDAKKCRQWAQAQGMAVGKRGVIATEIWDAYLAS